MKFIINNVSRNDNSETEILGTLTSHNSSNQTIKRVVKTQSVVTTDGYRLYFYGGHSDEEISPGESYSEDIFLSTPVSAYDNEGKVNLSFRLLMLEVESLHTVELDPLNIVKGISKHQISGLFGSEALANIGVWKIEDPKTTNFEFVVDIQSKQFIQDHQVLLKVDLIDSNGAILEHSSPVQTIDPFGSANFSSKFYGIKNKSAKNSKLRFTIMTFRPNHNLAGSLEATINLPA